jgi:hypothetical protein
VTAPRLRELEALQEPPEAPESAMEETERAQSRSNTGGPQVDYVMAWRRSP